MIVNGLRNQRPWVRVPDRLPIENQGFRVFPETLFSCPSNGFSNGFLTVA